MRLQQPSCDKDLAAKQDRLAIVAPGGNMVVPRKAAALGHFLDDWPSSLGSFRSGPAGNVAFRCAALAEMSFIDEMMREPDYAVFADLNTLWGCYAAELRGVRLRPDDVGTIRVIGELSEHVVGRLKLTNDTSDQRLDAATAGLKVSAERLLVGAKMAYEGLDKARTMRGRKAAPGQSATPVALTMPAEFRDAMSSLELSDDRDDDFGRSAQAFHAPLAHAAKRIEALVETRSLVLKEETGARWLLRGLGHHLREAATHLVKRALLVQ